VLRKMKARPEVGRRGLAPRRRSPSRKTVGSRGSGAALVRGGVEEGGCFSCGPRQHEVAGGDHTTAALPRARGLGHVAMGRRGRLASGPVTDSFSKISKPAQTL
jgi:hypothetical protein